MTEAEDRAEALFRALADRIRRDILRLVLAREHSVGVLAGRHGLSPAAVQEHVAVLARTTRDTRRTS